MAVSLIYEPCPLFGAGRPRKWYDVGGVKVGLFGELLRNLVAVVVLRKCTKDNSRNWNFLENKY